MTLWINAVKFLALINWAIGTGVSALPSHGRGHWFKSSIAHQKMTNHRPLTEGGLYCYVSQSKNLLAHNMRASPVNVLGNALLFYYCCNSAEIMLYSYLVEAVRKQGNSRLNYTDSRIFA